jgi:hypothetical protein
VIRTVWLTSLCLAVLVGLFATKVLAVPDPAADGSTMTGLGSTPDTLSKADKFAVVYVALPTEKLPPVAVTSTAVQLEPVRSDPVADIVGRERPAAMAKRAAVPLPRPRPNSKLAKLDKGDERAKVAPEIKTCRPQDPIASFLTAAGIAPRCES